MKKERVLESLYQVYLSVCGAREKLIGGPSSLALMSSLSLLKFEYLIFLQMEDSFHWS